MFYSDKFERNTLNKQTITVTFVLVNIYRALFIKIFDYIFIMNFLMYNYISNIGQCTHNLKLNAVKLYDYFIIFISFFFCLYGFDFTLLT